MRRECFGGPITLEFLWNFDDTIQNLFYDASLSWSVDGENGKNAILCLWRNGEPAPATTTTTILTCITYAILKLNDVVNASPEVFPKAPGMMAGTELVGGVGKRA